MPTADASRRWLSRPAVEVAPDLLGAVLTSSIGGVTVSVQLTEVEAYEGADDPASHAFRGRTQRNEVMFGAPGHLYCYFVYGMHWCANVTCGPNGDAAAVLLRAGHVTEGLDVARARTAAAVADHLLASGPARLARCLGVDRTADGLDLLDPRAGVTLAFGRQTVESCSGPRVGIVSAAERPWRFWIPGEPSVSKFRAGARRARRSSGQTSQP